MPLAARAIVAFLPQLLVPRPIRKILLERAEVLLIAPYWLRRPWFADLKSLSVTRPWKIPQDRISLGQGVIHHPEPHGPS